MQRHIILKKDDSEIVDYDHSEYPFYIRKGRLSGYPDFMVPNHWHDDIELLAVISGSMSYSINGEIVSLEKGEGIFVNSGQMHFGFSAEKSECLFLCILFHPMLLCSAYPYERDFVTPLLRSRRFSFLHLRPETGWQKEILCQMSQICRNRDSQTIPLRILAFSASVWAQLWEHASADDSRENRQSQDVQVVKNMVKFIQENYSNKISLREIADAGAVGQSKCCKLFQKYFAKTPNEYLTHYRITKSIDQLRTTDRTITEIALSSGFGNPSSYAEVFRKWMGKRPTDLRRK